MLKKPKMLKKGDTIGLCGPAIAQAHKHIDPAIENLEKMGFKVKLAKNFWSTSWGYAGSDRERADDLNSLLSDDSVQAVVFGGGEVSNEILPLIDYEILAKKPKIVSAFSDATTILNALTSRCGVVTFYGADPGLFARNNELNIYSFETRICSPKIEYKPSEPWRPLIPGSFSGRLTGGYLANYAELFGTKYFEQPEGKLVLFIEDHKMFNNASIVAKHFANLEMYGGFERVRGLIWGNYADEEHPEIDEILIRFGERNRIPVVACNDFGHGTYNLVLPIGCECSFDGEKFELLESGVE